MIALDIFALNERKCVIDRKMALLASSFTSTVTLGHNVGCTEGIRTTKQFVDLSHKLV